VGLRIEAADLVMGYHTLCANAPRRKQSFLSVNRKGVAPVDKTARRLEERLAMALFNQREIAFENGSVLRILDYQFPLKSKSIDRSVGKIDLLGLSDKGRLAIVELKVADNREDRRVALVEGLIYAAIVEANLKEIAAEVTAMHGYQVETARPAILLLAPADFWSSPRCQPPVADVSRLATAVSTQIPIDISLLSLEGAELTDLGADGTRPTLSRNVTMSPVRT
jgi:hypothetical protein